MKKSSTHMNVKNPLLVVFVLMLFLSASVTPVSAPKPTVAVDPPTVTIDELGRIGTVKIIVTNVINLYSWEIQLYFDNATLNFAAAGIPADHVFAGKYWVPIEPFVDKNENGTYLMYGCTLFPPSTPFNGSGTLCQINFTGMALGSSALTFSGPGFTFLLDPDGTDMPYDASDGNITVVPEFPTFALVPLIITLTLVATIIAKRKWSNKCYTQTNVGTNIC